jgi:flagellar hook-associated protein 3 FlgL
MTGFNRMGSVSLLNNTLGNITGLQRELADLQEQVSSGIKAKTFQQLNGQVEIFTLMESEVRRNTTVIEGNQLAIARLQTAEQAMSQLTDIADQMQKLMVAGADDATGANLPLDVQMRSLLTDMSNAINISFDGRYLFSGTATNLRPMPDPTIENYTIGVPDKSYYKGAPESVVLRADDNVEFTFPIRGDDPAFQKIYAAAQQALQAASGNSTNSGEQLRAALTLIQEGQDDLNALRARNNMEIINLTNLNERLDSLNLYWKGVTESVGKTDIVAVTTQIASYEASLQATFQVYARLSQLKLSDYL